VSRPPENARTMSREPGIGDRGPGRAESDGDDIENTPTRKMGTTGRRTLYRSPVPGPWSPRWSSQRRHHRLLHVQPVLRLVDGDAARGIHHRVGGLYVAA